MSYFEALAEAYSVLADPHLWVGVVMVTSLIVTTMGLVSVAPYCAESHKLPKIPFGAAFVWFLFGPALLLLVGIPMTYMYP